jgi:hypothetical protein
MKCWLSFASVALLMVAAPVSAAGISGKYIEARTCDVWVAPCFANAEMNLTGKNAVMAWKVDQGALDGVSLNGLGVVAVVQASDTLGLPQTGPAKAVLIVDAKASQEQRQALVRLAREQGGDLVRNVLEVQTAPIRLATCACEGGACATLEAGKVARIETRCIDGDHDKVCGNESAFYPPLAKDAKARAAVAVESRFTGKGFDQTWTEAERRGAYLGSFEIR